MSLLKHIVLFFATGLYSGHFPKAPGTAASVLGLAICLYLRLLPLTTYVITTIVFFFLACWIAGLAEGFLNEKDSKKIVIDEITGSLVAFAAIPLNWYWLVTGFVLFRLFDILKPFPIRRVERRLKGGWGVVLDDIVAGVYTLIIMQVLVVVIEKV